MSTIEALEKIFGSEESTVKELKKWAQTEYSFNICNCDVNENTVSVNGNEKGIESMVLAKELGDKKLGITYIDIGMIVGYLSSEGKRKDLPLMRVELSKKIDSDGVINIINAMENYFSEVAVNESLNIKSMFMFGYDKIRSAIGYEDLAKLLIYKGNDRIECEKDEIIEYTKENSRIIISCEKEGTFINYSDRIVNYDQDDSYIGTVNCGKSKRETYYKEPFPAIAKKVKAEKVEFEQEFEQKIVELNVANVECEA